MNITGNESLRKYPLAPEFIAASYAANMAAFAGAHSADGSIAKGASNVKGPTTPRFRRSTEAPDDQWPPRW